MRATRAEQTARDREWQRCAEDVAYWIDAYAWIEERQEPGEPGQPAAGGGAAVPFRLWPEQRRALDLWLGSQYAVCLKARQLGLTWLAVARSVHECLFRPSRLIVAYSIGQDEADDIVARAKFIYEHLPAWMRERVPVRFDSTRRWQLANRSTIRARAATKRAGRSYTASGVLLDEWAWMVNPQAVFDAAMAAVEAGGWLLGISTANGQGGTYFDVWTGAETGTNDFVPIFLPWTARPGRDAAWYAGKLRNANDPAIVQQEYPRTPQEAFIASGRVRFAPEWVVAQARNVAAGPLPRDAWPEALKALDLKGRHNRLEVFGLPGPGRGCSVGADCAEGIPPSQARSNDGGDFDAAVVVDDHTGEELAVLRGYWEPDEYAGLLAALHDAYDAPLVVERNNHGHAVLLALKALNAKRAAAGGRPIRVMLGLDGKPGWLTTGPSKEAAIGKVAERLRDAWLIVRSKLTLAELADYRYHPDGSLGASAGKHDDLVMAHAVRLGWATLRPRSGGYAAGGSAPRLPSAGVR